MAQLTELLVDVERGTCLLVLGCGINNNGDDITDSPVEDISEMDQHDDWDPEQIDDELESRIRALLADRNQGDFARREDWRLVHRCEYDESGMATGREEMLAGFAG